jgi:hypothetical protein
VSKRKKPWKFDIDRKPPRNARCPCGSNKKSKKCCYGPVNAPMPVPYLSMGDTTGLAELFSQDQDWVRRWGYTPGLAERSVMADGDEDEMVELVVRKLAALDANPKWIQAARELKMLVTAMNVELITQEQAEVWNELIGESPIELVKHVERNDE